MTEKVISLQGLKMGAQDQASERFSLETMQLQRGLSWVFGAWVLCVDGWSKTRKKDE